MLRKLRDWKQAAIVSRLPSNDFFCSREIRIGMEIWTMVVLTFSFLSKPFSYGLGIFRINCTD